MAEIYTKYKGDIEDTNQVCIVKLNGIILPLDVQIGLNGSKIIAQSQILDGVSVFERVTRKPFDVDFDFTMRAQKEQSPKPFIQGLPLNKSTVNKWIFPLDEVSTIFGYCWEVDQVLTVENIYLNKLGIQQVVVSDIQVTTIRGNVDVPIKLKCIEDFYSTKTQGTTLLI